MNEKTTLIVFKNSPHIWGGGLEGRELAAWLIGRANAILYQVKQQQVIHALKNDIAHGENEDAIATAYASLGVSLKEDDPIHSLSREAIQLDISLCSDAGTPEIASHYQVAPVYPVGFLHLPDLREEERKYQETRSSLLSQPDPARDWFSKKEGD